MSIAVEFAQSSTSGYLIVSRASWKQCPLKFMGNTFTLNLCPLRRTESTCCYNVENLLLRLRVTCYQDWSWRLAVQSYSPGYCCHRTCTIKKSLVIIELKTNSLLYKKLKNFCWPVSDVHYAAYSKVDSVIRREGVCTTEILRGPVR